MNRLATRVARLSLAAAALATTLLAGPAAAQPEALRGNVVIDGSSTVYPITEAVAGAFRDKYPNVNVTVAVSGTGGGFKRFVRGETDISNASRPIRAAEFQQAKQNGVEFIELPVALDGLSIVLNPANDWVDQLTIEQLRQIYLEDGAARRWSDLNPAWPDEPIKVYSPGTDSGTFDYFKEVIVGEGESFRADMSVSEDDNVLVTGVAGDKYSIGYFGASYYFENRAKLKAAPIVNPDTGQAYLPEPEHVISGAYAPLSRPIFIYVNTRSLRRPEVRRFAEFYMENAGTLATEVDYVALPDDVAATARDFLKKRKAGTVYLTPDLHKREGGVRDVYKEENLHNTR